MDELSNKRIDEILKMSDGIDFNNLIYYFTSPNFTPINFIGFRNPMHIYGNIKNGNLSTEKIEKHQEQFEAKVNEITTGNGKHKSKYQLDRIKNIENFYNSRETRLPTA